MSKICRRLFFSLSILMFAAEAAMADWSPAKQVKYVEQGWHTGYNCYYFTVVTVDNFGFTFLANGSNSYNTESIGKSFLSSALAAKTAGEPIKFLCTTTFSPGTANYFLSGLLIGNDP